MENAVKFLEFDPNPETRAEASRLLESARSGDAASLAELTACMNSRLEFGMQNRSVRQMFSTSLILFVQARPGFAEKWASGSPV